jgi:predicted Fe-Mo cluster-binding NifX family protein
VDAVLTGHIGRKASALLRATGIRIYLDVSGRVRKAIDNFKDGQYTEG